MDFNHLKKNLKKDTTGFQLIKVAVLCDFASQFLTQALKGYGIESGINYEIFEADYNQVDRQVLDPTSELYEFAPQYVIILRSSQNLLKKFYKTGLSERSHFAKEQAEHTVHLYNTILSKLDCRIIINTFHEMDDNVFGNFASKIKSSFIYQLRTLNVSLMDLSQSSKQLFIVDFNSIITGVGLKDSFDAKMYINADMVFSLDVIPALAKNITDIIQAIGGRFKKCLILDLDNTTWGGIIGDDGIEGIQVGDLGIGKAFTDLQLWAKELKNRGVIIAVCSKNTEEIAKEPFENHPEMVLKLSDIAIFIANWENKIDNIRHIQNVLNISFDSMVFLDDNPFEREMVKQAIPDITVPPLPEDPAEYLPYLRSLNIFETASFTEEDIDRTEQYQVESKRAILRQSYENENVFLERLQMKSEIKAFSQFSIPRVAQLSQRSNQFNLRTIRYTEEELNNIALSQEYITRSFTLEDVYGSYGLICFIILQKRKEKILFIDSWIMSCRVLKRGMEHFTLNTIVAIAKELNYNKIIGEYIPTKKNGLVKDHYQKLGFTEKNNNQWELDITSFSDNFKDVFIQSK
jgi:FkbH-like protein